MILRATSLALVLFFAALPPLALAQERQGQGQQQRRGDRSQVADDDDILNPTGINQTDTPTPAPTTTDPTIFDAAAQDGDILSAQPDGQATLEDQVDAERQQRVVIPPAEIRDKIDAGVRDIERTANESGEELAALNERAEKDPTGAAAEARRLAEESDSEFDELVGAEIDGAREEVDRVSSSMDGRRPGSSSTTSETSPWANVPDTPRSSSSDDSYRDPYRDRYYGPGGYDAYSSRYGYDDPYSTYASNGYRPIDYPAYGTADSGMSWWQKLLLKSLEGVAEGIKGLSERRANELKAKNERLRKEYPEYRAYIENETRRAVEASAFARNSGAAGAVDRRLDDLILGPARSGSGSGSTTTAGNTGTRPSSLDLSTRGVGNSNRDRRPVARLPRVPDEVTGEPRPIVDIPLGVDPVRPLR